MMTCDECGPFLDAYVDQELDALEVAEIDAHLSQCDVCRQRVATQVKFKEGFKSLLSEERAPDELRARIFEGLDHVHVEREFEEPLAEVVSLPARRSRWAMLLVPAAAALAFVFVVPNLTVAPAASDPVPVVKQTVEWHRGSFPVEVRGPHATEVSAWFKGKVEFPVRPPKFRDAGVQLVGGRLASIRDRRAAYLLYETPNAPLTVIAFDGQGLQVPGDKVRKIAGRDVAIWNQGGYEVGVVQDAGVTYAFASELDEAEFVNVLEKALQH